MRVRHVAACAVLALFGSSYGASAGTAVGDPVAKGVGRDLVPVAHIAYSGGTDIEFATVKGRDYAIAPAMGKDGGLRVIDIRNPERPRVSGFLPCESAQNDVQVRGTLVLMGVDYGAVGGACFEQVGAEPANGLLVVSIANPAKPRAIGFVRVPLGVHNSTWHPAGRYVYVSDSELTPRADQPPGAMGGRVHIVDLANPRAPKLAGMLPLPANVASAHDVTFNKSGTRAYVAAITTTLIVDSANPAAPKILTTIVDPAINISHGADPTPDGKYLLVTDEQAGAAYNGVCNVGGVHVFDISVNELAPVKVGFWVLDPADSATATVNGVSKVCTAHVLDYAPDGKSWSNADYAAGVRIVSATELTGRPKDLAYFTPVDAVTWSAKTYKSPRYLFANDLNRGFDVYRWEPGRGVVDNRSGADPISFARRGDTLPAGYCFDLPRARD